MSRASLVSALLRCTFALVASVVMASASGAQATRDTSSVLPKDVAEEVVSLFNATTTLRATDRLEIDSARTITGNIAVLNGPVIIAGHVTGRVLAINSDVVLLRG